MNILKLDPTLFVFLGTSSAEVGWRLRKLLENAYGEVPIFRYFWIDTDSNVEQNALEWLESGYVERSEIGDFNASEVLRNIDKWRHIKTWWPENSRIKPGHLGRGAKQIRLVGRLSLFRKFNDSSKDSTGSLYEKLQRSITEINGTHNQQETESMQHENIKIQVNRNRARIFIVYSTCGGTGSGTAFDIAFLCRNRLIEDNINGTITGISILPEVIRKLMKGSDLQQENKIKANTYAWFKENDHLIKEQIWEVAYPEVDVKLQNQPFDINFLVDIGNSRGQFLNSAEDIFKMISQSIFLMSSTAVAANADSMKDNMGITNEEFDGKMRSYSSFASAALIYPKERINNYCATKLATDVLRSVNIVPKNLNSKQLDSASIISQLGLSQQYLIDKLINNQRVVNDTLEFIQGATQPGEALQKITEESQNDQRELQGIYEKISRIENELKLEKKAALDTKIFDLLKAEGPGYVAFILDKLVEETAQKNPTSLAGMKKNIVNLGIKPEMIDSAKNTLDENKKVVADLSGNFSSGVIRTFIKNEWKDRLKKAKDACISEMDNINALSLKYKAEQSAISIYDVLIEEVNTLRIIITGLQETIRQTVKLLDAEADNYLSVPASQSKLFELTQEVVDKKYIENYYAKQSKDVDHTAKYKLFMDQQVNLDLNLLRTWDKVKLGKALQETARQTFSSQIEKVTILEAMQESYGEDASKQIKERLDLLVEYCYPFWRFFADSGLDPHPQGPSFLGIMDANTSLLPKEYRDHQKYQVVSTGLKDAIYLVRILHGVPASLLTGMSQWQLKYEQAKHGIDPLHIFPGAKDADEVLPEKDNRARDTFAHALAFGYITMRGKYFYYDARKRYMNSAVRPDRIDKISEGRATSEDAFVNRKDWVESLQNLIEDEIEQMGNIQAVEKIKESIRALEIGIDTLPPDSSSRDQLKKEIKALEKLKDSLSPSR
jgi:hypothetical protein